MAETRCRVRSADRSSFRTTTRSANAGIRHPVSTCVPTTRSYGSATRRAPTYRYPSIRIVQLECTASWQEGSSNYMVGRFTHKSIKSDEEGYRCFVYEATPEGFNVAQSADATCNGLYTATGGPVSMRLRKDSYPSPMCSFPSWMTSLGKWRTLQGHDEFIVGNDGGIVTTFNSRHRVERSDRCIEVQSHSDNMTTLVAFTIKGCHRGYKCYKIHKRGQQIIEIESGFLVHSVEGACKDENFVSRDHFETLVPATPLTPESCPHGGRYEIMETTTDVICSNRKSTASFGCENQNEITVEHLCEGNSINDVELQVVKDIYDCHGYWEEDGVHYLVASDKNSATICMVFSHEDGAMRIANHLTSCERPSTRYLDKVTEFSVTSLGQCYSSSAGGFPGGGGWQALLLIVGSLLLTAASARL
ncbi:PREDICTED: uncharacterized protein LOC106808439 [Priapulus caudatus]|uniref:Uncharacterized protein LOC106808439 n=1 Tax=Priapulus caudatus TaxID=37621 RepID=A0ABM1E378_PRICU|nr:PREDICTED: uncharacterized protein LOC106808439 [Priapulus caudatus]